MSHYPLLAAAVIAVSGSLSFIAFLLVLRGALRSHGAEGVREIGAAVRGYRASGGVHLGRGGGSRWSTRRLDAHQLPAGTDECLDRTRDPAGLRD